MSVERHFFYPLGCIIFIIIYVLFLTSTLCMEKYIKYICIYPTMSSTEEDIKGVQRTRHIQNENRGKSRTLCFSAFYFFIIPLLLQCATKIACFKRVGHKCVYSVWFYVCMYTRHEMRRDTHAFVSLGCYIPLYICADI